MSESIVIIGGAGKTGVRVAERLETRGITARPASRSTDISFDWANRNTWTPALAGASRAYVAYQPDISAPDAAADIAELADLARQAGLRQMVLLSGRGELEAQAAEVALQRSELPWTVVRSSWFAQNFSEGYLLEGVMAGEIALPAGDVVEPFADADDLADVAVAALTDERHLGKTYEITGRRALNFAEAANEISAAIGRPVRYVQITPDQFATGMRQAGLPEEIITLLNELFAVTLDGRNSQPMHGVEEAIGRPARDFSDFIRDAVASKAWEG